MKFAVVEKFRGEDAITLAHFLSREDADRFVKSMTKAHGGRNQYTFTVEPLCEEG